MLQPIMFQISGVSISTAPPCIRVYIYDRPYEFSVPTAPVPSGGQMFLSQGVSVRNAGPRFAKKGETGGLNPTP
jgi:hypothetical protein